jgi:hypothetical protein
MAHLVGGEFDLALTIVDEHKVIAGAVHFGELKKHRGKIAKRRAMTRSGH